MAAGALPTLKASEMRSMHGAVTMKLCRNVLLACLTRPPVTMPSNNILIHKTHKGLSKMLSNKIDTLLTS